MEEQWYVDRCRLRTLRQDHPDWTRKQLAEEIGRSMSWVKKWCRRLREAGDDDDQVLRGLSRQRKHPPEKTHPAVVAQVLVIRNEPPDDLKRIPGPKAILYYLHKDEELKKSGHYLPRSTSTIWGILDEYHQIERSKPRIHQPMEPAEPLKSWGIDFKDITCVPPEPEGKQMHQVETLDVVDAGTSILLDNQTRTDFNAETAIVSLTETFRQWGLPDIVTFDRDPRFVGSAGGSDYPSVLVRFLNCLGITADICPPRHPERNPFVERYHFTLEYEGVRVYEPADLEQVLAMNTDLLYHYNYQRPNQARSCGNQPPRVAFPDLPTLPPLPEVVDPDAWLQRLDGQTFKRRVTSAGTISIDKDRYYIGRAHQGRYVVVQMVATDREFVVQFRGQVIKRLPIKGLYDEQLSFEQYLALIRAEAVSEWRRYLAKATRRSRVTM